MKSAALRTFGTAGLYGYPHNTLEDRLRAVEDTLAIYHLIASHPPAADTGTDRYYRDAFTADGEIDLGGPAPARSAARTGQRRQSTSD